MKMFANQSLWRACALVALATWALGPQAAANVSFGSGDTIGGHPNTQGDNEGELETRPVFYLEGPRSLLLSPEDVPYSFVGDNGPGAVALADPAMVRLEFAPGTLVRVDLETLADPRFQVGFRVAPRGGVTKVMWDLGSHRSPVQTLSIGSTLELPVTRLRRAGILEEGIRLNAFHRVAGRSSYGVSADAGSLFVTGG